MYYVILLDEGYSFIIKYSLIEGIDITLATVILQLSCLMVVTLQFLCVCTYLTSRMNSL